MRLALFAMLAQIGFGQQIEVAPAKEVGVGTLLVATRKSHDADLKQSVVLVVHSGPEGVIGLILNHPVNEAAYFGGPIPIGVRTLMKSASPPESGERILSGVYMITSRKTADHATSRVYSGYVGWTPQQLRDEITLAFWSVRHADAAIVFDPHPETLWRRLTRS